MTATYTITEVLNLIAGATAIELSLLVATVIEEGECYNSHELAVIADQVSARRKVLQDGQGNLSLSPSFKNS
jgi:hypothetical protein